MNHYRNNHNTPWAMTETKRKLGVTPAELRVLLAIISHERVFGHSPTRAAVAAFLGGQPNGFRLVREGFLASRIIGPFAGQFMAIWSSTERARQALGFDGAEERLTA